MWFYLMMAVAGAIVPWYFNLHQMMFGDQLFTMANYIGAGMENDFTSSITTDFFIGTTPVLVWMIVEARRMRIKGIGWYVVLTFVISFAFTCPLFLFNRERKLKTITQ